MRLSRLLLVLLLLPGFALGPGWRLTICLQRVRSAASGSCCPSEAGQNTEPVAVRDACVACCIHIETPAEQRAPSQDRLAEQLERSQVAVLALSAPLADRPVRPRAGERSGPGPGLAPPGASGCPPLPLRI